MENEIRRQTEYSLIKYNFNGNILIFTITNISTLILEAYIKYEYSEKSKEVICTECYGAIIDLLEKPLDEYLYHFNETDQSLKYKLASYITRGMTNDLINSCNGIV